VSRDVPYLSIEKFHREWVLKIRESDTHYQVHPLTKPGCVRAGRALFEAGHESWLYSSSVDFPREYKPRFRHDVRDLIRQGYAAARAEADVPREAVVRKVLEWCARADFQDTLTDEERVAFAALSGRFLADQQEA
jgi:hypothetical protein